MEWRIFCWSARRSAALALLALAAAPALAEVTVGPPESGLVSMIRQATANTFLVPNTVIHVTGEMTDADAAKVTAELDAFWADRRNRFQEGAQIYAVLDSPGGSFQAGIAMARQFHEKGVSTLVPPNGSCLSACAVAFMAGRHVSMGGEGGVQRSRAVIMPAELGFHRPFLAEVGVDISPNVMASLTAEELGTYFADRFTQSFDAANALLQEMLAVDSDAWDPDLLLRMLTARQGGPDGGFVRLETVRDALTWDIDVPNIAPPPLTTERERFDAAFAFCFNVGPTLASSASRFWDTGQDLETTYEFNARGGHGLSAGQDGSVTIYIHHEAPMGCEVRFVGERPEMTVGQFAGEGETVQQLNDWLAGYHPDTRLRDIAFAVDQNRGHRCMVLAGRRVIDDEPCRLDNRVTAENEIVQTFSWPSGSRTVVQTQGLWIRLNGAATTAYRTPPAGMETCLTSEQTGNTFCYGLR